MKTPLEWLDGEQWRDTGDAEILKLIHKVQVDALNHAAGLVHNMSRGTKSEARAIAIDEAREILREEAHLTLKPV